MHTCIHAYMHTCIQAYMHTCIHAYMHACIRTYIHAHTRTHTQTHTHTHAHTPVQVPIVWQNAPATGARTCRQIERALNTGGLALSTTCLNKVREREGFVVEKGAFLLVAMLLVSQHTFVTCCARTHSVSQDILALCAGSVSMCTYAW